MMLEESHSASQSAEIATAAPDFHRITRNTSRQIQSMSTSSSLNSMTTGTLSSASPVQQRDRRSNSHYNNSNSDGIAMVSIEEYQKATNTTTTPVKRSKPEPSEQVESPELTGQFVLNMIMNYLRTVKAYVVFISFICCLTD